MSNNEGSFFRNDEYEEIVNNFTPSPRGKKVSYGKAVYGRVGVATSFKIRRTVGAGLLLIFLISATILSAGYYSYLFPNGIMQGGSNYEYVERVPVQPLGAPYEAVNIVQRRYALQSTGEYDKDAFYLIDGGREELTESESELLFEAATAFHEKTGVKLFFMFSAGAEVDFSTPREAAEYLKDYAEANFYDDAHFIFLHVEKADGESAVYGHADLAAEEIMDAYAVTAIKDEFFLQMNGSESHGYVGGKTPAEAFSAALNATAEQIMNQEANREARRQPLLYSECVEIDEWYENNFFDFEEADEAVLLAGLKEFYGDTGVQPYFILRRNAPQNDEELEKYLDEKYYQLFGDDGGHVIVFFAFDEDNNLIMRIKSGKTAEKVLDSDASYELFSQLENRFFISDGFASDYAKAFADSFSYTGDIIMSEGIQIFLDDDNYYEETEEIVWNVNVFPIFLSIAVGVLSIVVAIERNRRNPAKRVKKPYVYKNGGVFGDDESNHTGGYSENSTGVFREKPSGGYSPFSGKYDEASQRNPYSTDRDYSDSLPVVCPECRATGILTVDGRCRYCGIRIK